MQTATTKTILNQNVITQIEQYSPKHLYDHVDCVKKKKSSIVKVHQVEKHTKSEPTVVVLLCCRNEMKLRVALLSKADGSSALCFAAAPTAAQLSGAQRWKRTSQALENMSH